VSADHRIVEEGSHLILDFAKCEGLQGMAVLPAVLQDVVTQEVLMVGYMNQEALRISLSEGRVVLWSTSRNEIWRKGETSGDRLSISEVRTNCEQNSLLILVRKEGAGVCHTKGPEGRSRRTCYYRRLAADGQLNALGLETRFGPGERI
jgi:phosphoribosyl-AMP cyclohydrolase